MALQIHKKHRPGIVTRQHSFIEQIPGGVKKALLVALGLIVLMIVGGVLYTWYAGEQPRPVDPPARTSPRAPVIKKPVIDPTTPVGVSVQSLTSPITPGSNAAISVRTKSGATCSIKVEYNNVASTDSGLKSKAADEFGVAGWTWTVETTAPLGKWPVEVSCERDKKAGIVRAYLEIEAPGISD